MENKELYEEKTAVEPVQEVEETQEVKVEETAQEEVQENTTEQDSAYSYSYQSQGQVAHSSPYSYSYTSQPENSMPGQGDYPPPPPPYGHHPHVRPPQGRPPVQNADYNRPPMYYNRPPQGQPPFGRPPHPQGQPPQGQPPQAPYVQKSKLVAGILGILLGFLGIHNFYLGFSTKGVIQIVLSALTLGIAGIWGFIEGILYLTGSMNTDANGVPLKE